MSERRTARQEQAGEISEETARIHADSFGLEPDSVETVLDENLIVSILRFTLLPAEELVIAAGRPETVQALRQEAELELETALRAAVERITGRAVKAVLSQAHVEQGVVLELYTLAPSTDGAPAAEPRANLALTPPRVHGPRAQS
ncbi:MAG: Na-translocating system protein MpsC family protein [Gaiellaceae bacterium]